MNTEEAVRALEERNLRVEADKAWEISFTRRGLIALLTYAVVVVFSLIAGFPRPWLASLVPVAGFLLSTFSISIVKRYWLRNRRII